MKWNHEAAGRNRGIWIIARRGFLIGVTLLAGIGPLNLCHAQKESGDANAIVEQLSQLNLSNAPLTADQALGFKARLSALSALGTNALPAIRTFLQRNQDLYFDAPGSAELMGTPSLRVALFEVVGTLRVPAAISVLKTTFQATADPVELATLAKLLDRAEPAKHHAEFAAAARETLALAASGKWDGRDVAPLFELLGKFANAATAGDLERHANLWFNYIPMTLLALPDGAGVATLIKLAKNSDGRLTLGREAYLRALAGAAVRHKPAADELLTQTRADKIGAPAWPGIAAALAGYTLHFAHPVLTAPSPLVAKPGTSSRHIALGNQNILEAAPPEDSPAQDIGDRIRLIDRLLEATTNPAALDALEGARIELSAKLSRAK